MNNEAFNYAYDLFVNDGYNGSSEDFNNLMTTDTAAVDHAYSLFKNDGYTNSINDFQNLIKTDTSQVAPKKEIKESKLDDDLSVVPKYSTSETFGFLQSNNKKEYEQNIKSFFDANEEVAQVQLQKILGDSYEISQSTINMTSDPELKKYKFGLIGDFNQNAIKIKHKTTNKEIKINFGIGEKGGISSYVELAEELYARDSKKLFDFVNSTMSSEELTKTKRATRYIKKI